MSKLKLIKALRAAADTIERQPRMYCWSSMDSCNCGVVAQHLLGVDVDELGELRHNNDFTGTWSSVDRCIKTGLPMSLVYQKLAENGLDPKDVVHLEHLTNEAILEEAGISKENHLNPGRGQGYRRYFEIPENAVKYMRTWANQLCRQECKEVENV